jgi:alpha-tubulin suppressor-like RCC1 family protein
LFQTCILPVVLAAAGCGGEPTGNSGTIQLEFVQEPGGAVAGSAFARQPTVEVRNGSGQLVTETVAVTLTLTSNATGAGLLGTPIATTIGGTATFSDLGIDLVGSNYQITASSPNAGSAVSTAFDVTGPISAAVSGVTVPASLLLVGDTMTVALQARDASGTPLTRGGSAVTFALTDGSSAGTFAATTDLGDGTYTARLTATIAGTPGSVRATINGNPVGTAPPSVSVLDFVAISAGRLHTCGVTNDGKALCWGANAHGELSGVATKPFPPVLVSGPEVWAGIHAGHRNSCGLLASGEAYCWGNNEYSQIGNGTLSVRQNEPAAVSGALAFSRLDVGLGNTTGSVLLDQGFVNCGVTATGEGYCWGDGRFGQIGNGDVAERDVPTPISGGLSFGSVAAGSIHTCGIASDGKAWCWGTNPNGQLGIGTTSLSEQCDAFFCSTTPRAVSTTQVFNPSTIVVGTDHSCALTGSGAAYCWGANRFGALGDGSTSTTRTTPVAVSGGLSFAALTAGDAMTCGLTSGGTAYCWGKTSGPGNPTGQLTPTPVGGSLTFQKIDAGGSHVCGITTAGNAYCWGANSSGQLGTGNLVSTFSPARVRLR